MSKKTELAGSPAGAPPVAPADIADMDLEALRAELAASRATAQAATAAREVAELAALESAEALESAHAKLLEQGNAMARMADEIAVRPMVPGAVVGRPVYFAKCEISNSGRPLLPGHPLPFDPTDPPHGYSGLVEDIHYESR